MLNWDNPKKEEELIKEDKRTKPRALVMLILECQVFTYTNQTLEDPSEDHGSDYEKEVNESKGSMLGNKNEDMKDPHSLVLFSIIYFLVFTYFSCFIFLGQFNRSFIL